MWVVGCRWACLVELTPNTLPLLLHCVLQSHAPTDYDRWFQATSEYAIRYDFIYEPYVVVRYVALASQNTPTSRLLLSHETDYDRIAHNGMERKRREEKSVG